MSKHSKKMPKNLIITFGLVFVFAVLATLGLMRLIGGGAGASEKAPEFNFDSSVSEAEAASIKGAFSSDELLLSGAQEFRVSAETFEYVLPGSLKDNQLIYEISVPVVDFYDATLDIESEAAKDYEFVPILNLAPQKRLVSIDGNYFLDTFTSGARFRVLTFESGNAENNRQVVEFYKNSSDQLKTLASLKDNTLSFAQTGVTAISRAMNLTLNGTANGNGAYFAERIKDFLNTKDVTHISNEVSFVDNCPGGRNTMTLCMDWRALDTITAIGTDIVELTGNHNNNYGNDTNIATIEKYHELGIATVGGGIDLAAARIPVRIAPGAASDPENSADYSLVQRDKGAKITLLAYNKSSSTVENGELASASTPGANPWNEDNAISEIQAAKERGDFVILDMQFSECYCYPDGFVEDPECDLPISGQESFFRALADLGVDMVVGTQAHQPQTFEIYHGVPIYYGLGNLFFDQTYWPDTEKGLILTHYFLNGQYLQTRISPTNYEEAHQVHLMDTKTATTYLERLIKVSPRGE